MKLVKALQQHRLAAVLLAFITTAPTTAVSSSEIVFTHVLECSSKPCRVEILAQGLITAGSDERFRAEAARASGGPVNVRFDSHGGNLLAALLLGRALRDYRAMVKVGPGDVCVSACAYAFLGGERRRISIGGRFGVHHAYAMSAHGAQAEVPVSINQYAQRLLAEYIRDMGASPDLLQLANTSRPDEMRYLTPTELRQFKVIN